MSAEVEGSNADPSAATGRAEVVVTTEEVARRLEDPDWAVVDCRFRLGEPDAGRAMYRSAHIPGAVYADLDADLSDPPRAGITGRHPLPSPETFARRLGAWGIDRGVQVVAYDDMGGAIAARLWWMLGWLGHDRAAVLDGGWAAWTAEGRPARKGDEARPTRRFVHAQRPDRRVDAAAVLAALEQSGSPLLDARSAPRYRGEDETIDPVAGHIAGARSAPFADNLDASGRLRSPDALRRRFEELLGSARAADAIVYCGSGVTACHDVLAMRHAGLDMPRLYPGSWSEWITDPGRPIEAGGTEGDTTDGAPSADPAE